VQIFIIIIVLFIVTGFNGCLHSPMYLPVVQYELLYPVYTIQPVVKPVVQPKTSWMFVYTIQPVVQPVVQAGLTTGCIMYRNIQPVVKRFDNRIDNRLYRVNGI